MHAPLAPITGFDHACGTAVDVNGDVYVANAGDDEIAVFDPAHTKIASISDTAEPCGLAVDTKGTLYVVDRETGNVRKFVPDAFPLSGSPTYGAGTVVDSSGSAKGIAVDPSDNRLYVAEGTRITAFQADGTTGQDEVQLYRLPPAVTAGTYKLSFEGQETGPLAINATPQQVQAALAGLASIGSGNVTVEEGSAGTRSYRVTFTHALGSENVPQMTADSSGLTGGSVTFSSALQGAIDGFSSAGHIGEGELTDVTAVAAYTYSRESPQRLFLFAAESGENKVAILSGSGFNSLQVKQRVDGKAVPDTPECPTCSAGFGIDATGGGLGADWSTGHWFVYDGAHDVVDEFEASGQFVTQIALPALADSKPPGIAALPQQSGFEAIALSVSSGTFALRFEGETTSSLPFNASAAAVQAALEALPAIGAGNVSVGVTSSGETYLVHFTQALAHRNVPMIAANISGLNGTAQVKTTFRPGSGPGRVYVTSGASTGSQLLAFTSLPEPSRAQLSPPLSHSRAELGGSEAVAVATDTRGDVYVATGPLIHVFRPDGSEIQLGSSGDGIEDAQHPSDLAVDSEGDVYVIDAVGVTYYQPNAFPPTSGTTYTRHEPPLVTGASFPSGDGPPVGIAIGAGDRLLATSTRHLIELKSRTEGSGVVRTFVDESACKGSSSTQSIDADRLTGDIYLGQISGTSGLICVIESAGLTVRALIDGSGGPGGAFSSPPQVAVDQSNGHVVAFNNKNGTAEEFDASGAFVAQFGTFTSSIIRSFRVDLDSSCALHTPPLDETTTPTCQEFDPANGNVYVAFDDSAPGAFDLSAFAPLVYGEPPLAVTEKPDGVGAGGVTFHGTVNPRGFPVTECRFEYLLESDYEDNIESAQPAFTGATPEECTPEASQIGSGRKPVAVQATVSGLESDKAYVVRLVAEDEFGASEGSPVTFGPPALTSLPTVPILYREATLNAELDPRGLDTKYFAEFGTEGNLDRRTAPAHLSSGASKTKVSIPLTGLEEGQAYEFRLVATNEAGEATLSGQFETLKRSVEGPCANSAYRTGIAAHLPDCRAYELVTPAETGGLSPFAGIGSADEFFNGYLVLPRDSQAGERLSYYTSGTLPGFDGNGRLDGYRAERAPGEHPEEGWRNSLVGPAYSVAGDGTPTIHGVASDQLYAPWTMKPQDSFSDTLPAGTYLRLPETGAGCGATTPPSSFEALGCGSLGKDLQATSLYVGPGGTAVFSSKAKLEPEAAPAGTASIYRRSANGQEAEVVSVQPGGAPFGAGEDATYVGANEDGTAVAFRVGGTLYLNREGAVTQVTPGASTFAGLSEDGDTIFYATPGGGLFAFDADASTQIAAKGTFVNVSADGSHVFFTSEEELTPSSEENDNGEAAELGKPNLYAWNAATEATSFIAILAPKDLQEFGGSSHENLAAWTTAINPGVSGGRALAPSRSTPDGNAFAFQSHAQLTGYGNEGLAEVYLYRTDVEPGEEELICASCAPSGVAPGSEASFETLEGSSLSVTTVVPNVTDGGRLVFFESLDRLLPEDVNEARDVYEWEAKGTHGCELAPGCLGLISSGQGEGPSFIFGMGEEGRDVFFSTLDKLVETDVSGSPSIYDARIEGGIPTSATEAPCQGDACQPPPSPQPPLAAPGSTGSSSGNVEEEEPVASCGKGRHRVKGRCVKIHKKHHRKSHQKANGSNRGGRR